MKKVLSKSIDWIGKKWILILSIFVLFFVVKNYALSIYKIPTGSMLPNIWPGDWVVVNKVGYGGIAALFGKEVQLPTFRKIKRGNVMVFHFPEGDTVFKYDPFQNYYDRKRWSIVNKHGANVISTTVEIPLRYRLPYVKRCLGLPGDSLTISRGRIAINGSYINEKYAVKRWYHVYSKKEEVVEEAMAKVEHSCFKTWYGHYVALLTFSELKESRMLIEEGVVDSISPYYENWVNHSTYPFLGNVPISWTWDNYGPVYVPKKGDTLKLTGDLFYRYQRLIETYEGNDLMRRGDIVLINGHQTDYYVCKQNYYFMMGDNRHNSMDSRNWGLVPENHIIGRFFMVGWSTNENKESWESVRWNRIGKSLQIYME